MTSPFTQPLREAVNLLAEYAISHLAPGWRIELTLCDNEATLELYDPDGDQIHVDVDYGQSTIVTMCARSHDH